MQYSRPNSRLNLDQNLANFGQNCENLGKAYIPFQSFDNLFSLEEAIDKGTLFRCLYRPYKKGHGKRPCYNERQVNPHLPAR